MFDAPKRYKKAHDMWSCVRTGAVVEIWEIADESTTYKPGKPSLEQSNDVVDNGVKEFEALGLIGS